MEWREIPGYEGIYKVSDTGVVVRYDREWCSGKNGCTCKKIPESEVHQRTTRWGYKVCTLCKDGVKKTKRVHVLVAMAFIPCDDVNKTQVNHKDFDKTNNSIDNLEWCTPSYNVQYNAKKGSIKYRSIEKRKLIFDDYMNGKSILELCEKYQEDYPYIYYNTVTRKKRNRKFKKEAC